MTDPVKPMLPATYPNNAWEEVSGNYVSNSPAHRDPELLVMVVRQFQVATRPRYQRKMSKEGKVSTFCNIFVCDFTLAMMCHVPHWVFAPVTATSLGSAAAPQMHHVELNAYGTIQWIRERGPAEGWAAASAAQARAASLAGHPALVTWTNPQHWLASSHLAVCLPSPQGGPQMVAQSGYDCFESSPIGHGFGPLGPLEYWVHA